MDLSARNKVFFFLFKKMLFFINSLKILYSVFGLYLSLHPAASQILHLSTHPASYSLFIFLSQTHQVLSVLAVCS